MKEGAFVIMGPRIAVSQVDADARRRFCGRILRDPILARELRRLVGIENLGLPMFCNRLLEHSDTKVRARRVRQPPSLQFAARHIQNRDRGIFGRVIYCSEAKKAWNLLVSTITSSFPAAVSS